MSGTDLRFNLQLVGSMTADPPPLFLRQTNGSDELSWPAAYNGWSLRVSPDLGQTPWVQPPAPALLDAGWIYVTTPSGLPRQFFRLVKP